MLQQLNDIIKWPVDDFPAVWAEPFGLDREPAVATLVTCRSLRAHTRGASKLVGSTTALMATFLVTFFFFSTGEQRTGPRQRQGIIRWLGVRIPQGLRQS